MPTYLVAFVVSDFEGERTSDSMHGIYTPPHLLNQTTYGLEFAEQVFKKLDEFTDYPIFNVPDIEKMVIF
jgi:aminopeptidase N